MFRKTRLLIQYPYQSMIKPRLFILLLGILLSHDFNTLLIILSTYLLKNYSRPCNHEMDFAPPTMNVGVDKSFVTWGPKIPSCNNRYKDFDALKKCFVALFLYMSNINVNV